MADLLICVCVNQIAGSLPERDTGQWKREVRKIFQNWNHHYYNVYERQGYELCKAWHMNFFFFFTMEHLIENKQLIPEEKCHSEAKLSKHWPFGADVAILFAWPYNKMKFWLSCKSVRIFYSSITDYLHNHNTHNSCRLTLYVSQQYYILIRGCFTF